jgi:hypothetical protein
MIILCAKKKAIAKVRAPVAKRNSRATKTTKKAIEAKRKERSRRPVRYLVTFSAINPTVEIEAQTKKEAATLAMAKIDEIAPSDIQEIMMGVTVEKVEPL